MVSYKKARLKLKMELMLMWPFVVLGKLYGRFRPLKHPVDIFFFFPNADIGGSPKVNLDIVDCIKADKRCMIIFSKKPKNNLFADRFKALDVPIIDLQARIDNKWFHFVNFFYRGVIASWISAQSEPTVFGGECIFLYKIIPHLPVQIRKIDLSHLATWIHYTIAFAPYLDVRLYSTLHLMRSVHMVYQKAGVPDHYTKRFSFIDNTIELPTDIKPGNNECLEIIFVGRGSQQKRPELVAKIAERLHEKGAQVHFSFIGDVALIFDPARYPFCSFYGNVNQKDKLMDIYANADVLMLTSAFEGLPIVVMQMMAYGKVIISTAVGGIPDYIIDGENGYLIHEKDENAIIERGVQIVEQLIGAKSQLQRMGEINQEKAKQLFGKDVFCQSFRNLLLGA